MMQKFHQSDPSQEGRSEQVGGGKMGEEEKLNSLCAMKMGGTGHETRLLFLLLGK